MIEETLFIFPSNSYFNSNNRLLKYIRIYFIYSERRVERMGGFIAETKMRIFELAGG